MASIHIVFDEDDRINSLTKVKGVHAAVLRLDDNYQFSPEEIESVSKRLIALLLESLVK